MLRKIVGWSLVIGGGYLLLEGIKECAMKTDSKSTDILNQVKEMDGLEHEKPAQGTANPAEHNDIPDVGELEHVDARKKKW